MCVGMLWVGVTFIVLPIDRTRDHAHVALMFGCSRGAGDPGFSLFFFFSCFARSSAFVSLVNAMVFPSGAQTGLPAPFGRSVKTKESPPAVGRIASCGGSGLPSFSVARRKSKNFPSGDQRGAES